MDTRVQGDMFLWLDVPIAILNFKNVQKHFCVKNVTMPFNNCFYKL